MRLPDGTDAQVTDLTHDATDLVIATVTVALPDGRTMVSFLQFTPTLLVTAGVVKAPGLGR